MNIKPTANYILIKPDSPESVTESGIIIPDTASKDQPERGEVISVGPGELTSNGERSSMEMSEGQIVLFKKYSPIRVEIDDEEYLIVKSGDVIAIIE